MAILGLDTLTQKTPVAVKEAGTSKVVYRSLQESYLAKLIKSLEVRRVGECIFRVTEPSPMSFTLMALPLFHASTLPLCPMHWTANLLQQQECIISFEWIFSWPIAILYCAENNWCKRTHAYAPVTHIKCLVHFFAGYVAIMLVHVVGVAVCSTACCMCLCTFLWSHY